VIQWQGRWRFGEERPPFEVGSARRPRPCTVYCPRPVHRGIDLGQFAAILLWTWLALAGPAAAAEPVITVENEAAVPPAELDSIVRDFRAWAARVYRYNHVADPAPVTLKLTRKVPFGFYRDATVLLPPSADRWEMLDNWIHELTHHATGHDSSFFFKEGIAVHTLEALFAEERRVPQTWPQFGQTTDAWVSLYAARGRMPKLADALAWPRYRGGTPDDDFRSWQIYNLAGSFVGWYIGRHGYDAFRTAFRNEWPAQDSSELEREWFAAIAARKLPEFNPAAVMPRSKRYRQYAERLTRR